MRHAHQLSKKALEEIVSDIQVALYGIELNGTGNWVLSPDAEWGSETVDMVDQALIRHGLRPSRRTVLK
jgi:hypothetical protein